jgi:NADH pyrophosphatase NudC (nudix superfamily)
LEHCRNQVGRKLKESHRFSTQAKPQELNMIYCSSCGNSLDEAEHQWPKTCKHCQRTSYRNTIPVSVVLLPVKRDRDDTLGILTQRRKIPPGNYIVFVAVISNPCYIFFHGDK